jgi:hypothetical protein
MVHSQPRNETLTARHFTHSGGCRLHIERAMATVEIFLKKFTVSVLFVGVEEETGAPVSEEEDGGRGPDLAFQVID